MAALSPSHILQTIARTKRLMKMSAASREDAKHVRAACESVREETESLLIQVHELRARLVVQVKPK